MTVTNGRPAEAPALLSRSGLTTTDQVDCSVDITSDIASDTSAKSGAESSAAVPAADPTTELEAPHGLGGRLRAFFHGLAANKDTHDARQLQKDVATLGATPIKRCTSGSRTSVVGTIRSITLQPITGTPALHADLWDGTGSLTLIWLGRRTIPGIDPGRTLVVEGRVVEEHGRPTMFNPRYQLRCGEGASE